MKTLLLAILALTLGFASCKKCDRGTASSYMLRVDLQETYENDMVVVYLDNCEVYSGQVVTNHLLGLAKSIGNAVSPGTHELRISVNNKVSTSTTVSVSSDVYVGVGYSSNSGNITFDVSQTPFLYE